MLQPKVLRWHAAIELSKDFLWSYTWPLWRTVQANMSEQEQPDLAFNSMFVWNEFLTRRALRYLIDMLAIGL